MKRFLISLILAIMPMAVMAGIQDGQLIRRGFNYGVYAVNVNSTTPTLVSGFNTQKIDIMVRYTSSYDIFICTSAYATKPATAASGCFPTKSGEKIRSDGYFPGELYMIGAEGMGTTSINVIEFYRQEY